MSNVPPVLPAAASRGKMPAATESIDTAVIVDRLLKLQDAINDASDLLTEIGAELEAVKALRWAIVPPAVRIIQIAAAQQGRSSNE